MALLVGPFGDFWLGVGEHELAMDAVALRAPPFVVEAFDAFRDRRVALLDDLRDAEVRGRPFRDTHSSTRPNVLEIHDRHYFRPFPLYGFAFGLYPHTHPGQACSHFGHSPDNGIGGCATESVEAFSSDQNGARSGVFE